MLLTQQSLLQDLIHELRVNGEQNIHWFTKFLGDVAGGFPFVGILAILMLLDIATGLVAAFIKGEVNSNCSFRGAFKKVQMLLLVAAGLTFELIYPDVPWGKVIAFFFSLGEMISIVENAGNAGLPIPEQLKETLARLKSTDSTSPAVRIEILQEKGEKGDKGDKGDNVMSLPVKQS